MTTKPVEVKSSNQIVQNQFMVILGLIVWITPNIGLKLEGWKAQKVLVLSGIPASSPPGDRAIKA